MLYLASAEKEIQDRYYAARDARREAFLHAHKGPEEQAAYDAAAKLEDDIWLEAIRQGMSPSDPEREPNFTPERIAALKAKFESPPPVVVHSIESLREARKDV